MLAFGWISAWMNAFQSTRSSGYGSDHEILQQAEIDASSRKDELINDSNSKKGHLAYSS
jgi:hypothetical protein